MAVFADLHIQPRADDDQSTRRMAELLRMAGYLLIGLTVPTGLMPNRVSSLRRVFEEHGIETLLRADVIPRSRDELLRVLRRYRSRFDLIAVKCMNAAVASVACRDRRVDVVFFDPSDRRIRFSYAYANLLRGALEFNLVSTLLSAVSETYSRIAREAAISRARNTKTVLSCGASSPDEVRSPMQVSALGRAIGLSMDQALGGVSKVPTSIAHRTLERRSSSYVEEGVRIVSRKAR